MKNEYIYYCIESKVYRLSPLKQKQLIEKFGIIDNDCENFSEILEFIENNGKYLFFTKCYNY